MTALELYTHPMSPCAQKVRIVLAEKNLDWMAHHVDLAQKQNLRPEYLKLNPLGVVPTLVHGDHVVIESNIICEYLDDRFPQTPLTCADPFARAQMRLWMKHVDGKLHPACGALQWTIVMRPAMLEKPQAQREALLAAVPDEARRERQKRLVAHGMDAPDIAGAVKTYRKTVLDMEAVLQRTPWVSGPDYALADICLAPYFQTLMQFGWLDLFMKDCPATADWFKRIQARDSYRRAVAADFPAETLEKLKAAGGVHTARIASLLG